MYGTWNALDQDQTYPAAKHIRRSGVGFDLVDLNYDDEYSIKVVSATDTRILFIRAAEFPACSMHHDCRLDGEQLHCSLRNVCRDGKRQAQGIPVKCR